MVKIRKIKLEREWGVYMGWRPVDILARMVREDLAEGSGEGSKVGSGER